MFDPRKKILVMEQDQDLLNIIVKKLELNDFEVLAVDDGAQGMSLSRERRPDLVIMDVMTPNLPGKEAARAFTPEGIPILFLKDMLAKTSGLEEGVVVDGVLYPTIQKPFYSGDLLKMVKAILEINSDK